MTEPNTGWFVSESDPEDAVKGAPYQAFAQVAGGCFPLPIWFDTEADAEQFIRHWLVGLPMLADNR